MHNAPAQARRVFSSIACPAVAALLAGMTLLSGGCEISTRPSPSGSSPAVTTAFVDSAFGFRSIEPPNWPAADAKYFVIPGEIVKAWASSNGSSIVAFHQQASRPVTAQELLASSAEATRQMHGTIISEEIMTIGATEVMSLQVTLPGNGVAVMPGGSVSTYQHWIAVPKENRVLVLLATAPDASKGATTSAFDEMIQSIAFD